ncbi:hypothetical protein OJF2_17890 [Aquisphaera giovannonii]|uniref:Uncharacterized protein n=1 Tax=Aquisphaera giovannonii TaxID=406548 RepID=A0A5B9VYA1_9BACT|nr:hypothetical protein OJF2_17890 [Aquisphaera giovannonii]
MRSPRLRFSIRSIMVVIAIVSFGFWAKGTLERRAYCQRRAAYWAARERSSLKSATDMEGDSSATWRAWSAVERESAARYGRLRSKYERGAACPWSMAVPDPEEYRGRIHPGVGLVPEGLEGE